MIDMLFPMRTETRRARFSRAIAGVCVALWLAGSASTLYGSPTPQWTTLHCPQSHSSDALRTHGFCAWHCIGIEAQSDSGRPWATVLASTGFDDRSISAWFDAAIVDGWMSPRGPPLYMLNLSII